MDPDLYFPLLAATLKPLSYMLFALGALPLLLGIGCLVAYLRAKLTPTTPINEIKEGSAEVKGTVKAIGPLLKSPISHQDCVLYAVIFHGGGGMSRHGTTTRGISTLFWEIQSTPFSSLCSRSGLNLPLLCIFLRALVQSGNGVARGVMAGHTGGGPL